MPDFVNAVKKLKTLRNSRQFRQVYEQGQRVQTSLFSAFILKTTDGEQRIGLTVTRKIGNAVVRNRCKRRLREALRKYFDESANTASFDLVINARSYLVEAEFQQIVDGVAKTLNRFCESLPKSK